MEYNTGEWQHMCAFNLQIILHPADQMSRRISQRFTINIKNWIAERESVIVI